MIVEGYYCNPKMTPTRVVTPGLRAAYATTIKRVCAHAILHDSMVCQLEHIPHHILSQNQLGPL